MELSQQTGGDAKKSRRRIGRGNGSGHGKTSGKGHKGQKARTGGKVAPGFEGGQMPLFRRLPNLGFRSRKKTLGLNQYNIVNLSVLERFDSGSVVDREGLRKIGFGTNASCKAGVKILGSGDISKALTVKVQAISKGAQQKIEAAGGSVEIVSL